MTFIPNTDTMLKEKVAARLHAPYLRMEAAIREAIYRADVQRAHMFMRLIDPDEAWK